MKGQASVPWGSVLFLKATRRGRGRNWVGRELPPSSHTWDREQLRASVLFCFFFN